MKKKLMLFSLGILSILPILVYISTLYHYSYYDKIGKIYDCYPIEKCRFDIDGDSSFDKVEIVDDSNKEIPYSYRLKVLLIKGSQEIEVLNIKYEPTDNSYRTHLGFLVENNVRKIVIYDTINEHHFFEWDGQKLIPSKSPSHLEKEIRKSFYYNDDTGGFHQKIIFQALSIPFFITYGLFLLIIFTIFEYKRRQKYY